VEQEREPSVLAVRSEAGVSHAANAEAMPRPVHERSKGEPHCGERHGKDGVAGPSVEQDSATERQSAVAKRRGAE
jgi:hypothetical protein